jgi:hypothetical protein
MKNIKEIVNELGAISPSVAAIPRGEAPYVVPSGYFERFADKLVARIKKSPDDTAEAEMGVLSPFLSRISRSNPHDVPAGYFEGFPQLVLSRIHALEADSPSEELERLSPLLSGLEKKTPFSLPAGYFKELPVNLVAGMQAVDFVRDELEDTPAVLGGLKEKETYQVPEGYFDSLPGKVLQQVSPGIRPARVVSMTRRKTWMRYAVAAAVVGIVLTGSLLYFNRGGRGGSTVEDPAAGLVKVSDQEIVNYLENEYIPLSGSSTPGNGAAIASIDDFSDNDIREMMSDVSDKELEQYATDHLSSKDLQTN